MNNPIEPTIIKSEEQYLACLDELARLAAHDPDVRSPDGGRLELLAKLVEDFEKSRHRFEKPDPIDAIAFSKEERKGAEQ